jgi:hypothetical protein
MLSDMLLIGLNLAVGSLPIPLSIIVIYASSIIYFSLNLVFLKSRIIQGALVLYLAAPVVSNVILALRGDPTQWVFTLLLSALISGLFVFFTYLRQRQEEGRLQDHRDLEMRFQVADSTLRILQLRERLLLHDFRNLLGQLGQVDLAEAQGRIHPSVANSIRETRTALVKKLDALRELETIRFHPREWVENLVRMTPPGAACFQVEIPSTLAMRMDAHLFESIVYNLCRNAWEAWSANHGNFVGFHMIIAWENEQFVLVDNAGGFDPARISPGFTTKPGGQGLFLHTLIEHQKSLGLGFEIKRGAEGMIARLSTPA